MVLWRCMPNNNIMYLYVVSSMLLPAEFHVILQYTHVTQYRYDYE